MSWLLDVNVLIALFWEYHLHNDRALAWFAVHRTEGWATCCLTELGFLRISMQAVGLKEGLSYADAFQTLTANLSAPDHEFWPMDYSFSEILPQIRGRLRGPKQLTDALLLDLAIRKQGRFVTFDKSVQNLLPPDSPHRAAIELLVIE
jgi:toxin-antitoxin system PIN domain toxin